MQPRITLALLTYRQSDFIEAATRSALAQVCEPIEIILSDDASPDDTFEKMQALAAAYQGPHQVVVRRNARNLGIGDHFNAVLEAASGRLMVMTAGDDICAPQRVAEVARAWDASGEKLDLIASHLIDLSFDDQDLGAIEVDDLARWPGPEAWCQGRPYIVGASHAFTKRLFARFGPIAPHAAEDQINVFRALCSGGAATLPHTLVRYRRGGMSDHLRDFSAEQFMAATRRQNVQNLAVHTQWRRDARVAGCEAIVAQATEREYQVELFLQALLAARTFAQRLGVTLRPWHVPLGRRLRKFFYIAAPTAAARVRQWQVASNRWRRGDRR